MHARVFYRFILGFLLFCVVALWSVTATAEEKQLSQEEKVAKQVAGLCGPFDGDLKKGCEVACKEGQPVKEVCVQFLRFEGRARPLIEAQEKEAKSAVALEERALASGWSAPEALALRRYVNGVYHWADPVVDSPNIMSKPSQAAFVVNLLQSPDGSEIQSGVMSDEKYVSRREMYELLPTFIEKEFGPHDLNTMKVHLLGSRFMLAASDEERALAALDKAHGIAVAAKVPKEHPYFAEIEARRILLRCIVGWQCDIEVAERHLAHHEAVYGPLNPRTLRLRRVFARALANSGEEARAREVMLWTLRRYKRVLGEVAPETAFAYVDMAEIAMHNGDHIFASGMFASAEVMIDQYYGKDSHAAFRLRFINGKERVKFAVEMAGKENNEPYLKEAKEHFKQALKIQRVTFGKDDEFWKHRILIELARLYLEQREARLALRSAKDALVYFNKQLAQEHPVTLDAIEQMSRVMILLKGVDKPVEIASLLTLTNSVRSGRADHSVSMVDNTWLLAKAERLSGLNSLARTHITQALAMARDWVWRQGEVSGSGIQSSYALVRMLRLFHDALAFNKEMPEVAFEQVLLWQGLGMQVGRRANANRIAADNLDGDDAAWVRKWRAHRSGELLLGPDARKEAISRNASKEIFSTDAPARPSLETFCKALRQRDATLVNYVATMRGGTGKEREDLVYAAFVVDGKSCVPRRFDLAKYHDVNGALLAWREAVEKTQTCYEKRGNALGCLKQMAEVDAHAAKLHGILWAPLEGAIKAGGKDRLLVVPDGELGALPFEGLVGADSKYLIEKHDLRFLPYPAALLDPMTGEVLPPESAYKGRRKKGSALVLGDIDYESDAPDALKAFGAWIRCGKKGCDAKMADVVTSRKLAARVAELTHDGVRGNGASHCGRGISWAPLQTEARAVAEMLGVRFGDRVTLVTGDAAYEPLVSDAMEGPEIIHIATHGFFIEDRDCKLEVSHGGILEAFEYVIEFGGQVIDLTRQSGIVLTGASRKGEGLPPEADGLLDGSEIRKLDLSKAELISLSACETGLGLAFAGDGVHALMRALIEAGARRTITSLWQVPSQPTSDLFIQFYDGLLHPKKAVDAPEALRASKMKAIESARARGIENNAFLWAGFVLYSAP